jgi:AcrR family transcriptional regulator
MIHDPKAALRHTPKQTRGLRKVDHILQSAEVLFAEVGFDGTTTNAIAAKAGVSIGSLYQFFASKEAILEVMATGYLEQTRVSLTELLESNGSFGLEGLLTKLLDVLISLQEQRPYFLQCLGHTRPSSVLNDPVDKLSREVAGQVQRLLKRASTEQDPKVLELRSRICVETISALLPMAVGAKGRARVRAVTEIKLVLGRYLEPTLKTKGVV